MSPFIPYLFRHAGVSDATERQIYIHFQSFTNIFPHFAVSQVFSTLQSFLRVVYRHAAWADRDISCPPSRCGKVARMAESVDALVSNTSAARRAGSTPAPGTFLSSPSRPPHGGSRATCALSHLPALRCSPHGACAPFFSPMFPLFLYRGFVFSLLGKSCFCAIEN